LKPPHEHQRKVAHALRCAIITVSDTRTEATDTSGAKIRDLLGGAGHEVVSHEIIPDEPARIRSRVEALLAMPDLHVILLNGGTGVAPRDTTFEAVCSLLDKTIDGFGELFRMLSYQEIGSAAMLSRAVAGIAAGKLVVSMPGSTAAVELAMRKLIVPELGHILSLLEA
jgi:molybdopterin adenylyltransferase